MGALVYARDHIPSEQTDPRKALPTTSSCWMGFRIAPSNASELVGEQFRILFIFMQIYKPTFTNSENDNRQNETYEPERD